MCVYVCVFVFFVVWCRWWWSGVWCGVNGANVAEQLVWRVFFLASFDEYIAAGRCGAFSDWAKKWMRSCGFFWWPLGSSDIRGQILVTRKLAGWDAKQMSKTLVFTDENTPSARVSTQTRPHMYVENVPVCTGTTRTCFNTCARCAGIHGDVLNVHMGTCLSGHGFS